MAMQCTTIAGGNQKNAEDMLGRKERAVMAKIPDLKRLECLAWAETEGILSKQKRKIWMSHTSVDLFLQMWPDTSCGLNTGFSCAGQMLTEEYTSVFELRWVYSDTSEEALVYYVFFGNKLAYCVRDPNAKFFEDLKNRNMAAVVDKDKYSD